MSLFSPFSWIRSRVKHAILEGVADALTSFEEGSTPLDDVPESLRKRLLPMRDPAGQPAAALTSAPAPEAQPDVPAEDNQPGRKRKTSAA